MGIEQGGLSAYDDYSFATMGHTWLSVSMSMDEETQPDFNEEQSNISSNVNGACHLYSYKMASRNRFRNF